jgi:DNA (cytosine-5)-methyltransferase 1
LFAGCGGLTLGAAEAARRLGLGIDVRLAVDFDETATEVYRSNLPTADVRCCSVEALFTGDPGTALTASERALAERIGRVHLLLGGPPCQGHSDLNNHTRRFDPRNLLYLRMARATEVLKPDVVLIENVPMVTHDTEKVVETTLAHLQAFGYVVGDAVVDLARLGAPQRRRRHVVLASWDRRVDVAATLATAGPRCAIHTTRTVHWAISDLVGASSTNAFDSPPSPNAENLKRIAWLFDHGQHDLPNDLRPACHQSEHSYKAMYGRLKWDSPAQTVTTGFGSMGQGRYVHPAERRTITPHEAARLQLIPDFWSFSRAPKRGQLATLIGNAVPPVLASSLLEPVMRSLGWASPVESPIEPGDRRLSRQSLTADAKPSSHKRAGVPGPSSTDARNRMLAVRRAGTGAELALHAAVHRLGLAFRVDERISGTRSRADLLFEEAGVVVLMDGCYWHSCPLHGTASKANAEWWQQKLAANRTRDEETDRRLHHLGWVVLRFWEHDDPSVAANTIAAVVAERVQATWGRRWPRMSKREVGGT